MLLADRILFIDAEAIVLDKPAGLPVDAPRDGTLSVENHLDALRFGFARRPTIVHRLDRDTSGCLLLARNPKAHRRFAAAFEAGDVAKTYLAVLNEEPAGDGGTIGLAISKTSTRESGWRMIAASHGKPATTRWRKIATLEGRTLVEFKPETGRTHQIRIHAAAGIGIPIAGDPVYGDGHGPMLLHAERLELARGSKSTLNVNAPLPADFGIFADLAKIDDALAGQSVGRA